MKLLQPGRAVLLGVLCLTFVLSGCKREEIAAGIVGGGIVAATTPSNDLRQIYYLGVIDPAGQLPPTLYRVVVKGQAGTGSSMRFASGWVPAYLIDSLNTRLIFDKNEKRPKVVFDRPGDCGDGARSSEPDCLLKEVFGSGRRSVQFGPDGFDVAPEDHRLAIVMGSDADAFFQAIDESLAFLTGGAVEQDRARIRAQINELLLSLKSEEAELNRIETEGEKQ